MLEFGLEAGEAILAHARDVDLGECRPRAEAVALLEKARSAAPEAAHARYHLAIAYRESGRTGEARAQLWPKPQLFEGLFCINPRRHVIRVGNGQSAFTKCQSPGGRIGKCQFDRLIGRRNDGKTVAESMHSPWMSLAARGYGWIVRQRVRMDFYSYMPEVHLIRWALAHSR